MIHVKPEGGLCNRMRVIDSAWELATEVGSELTVHWLPYFGLNARFDELFDPTVIPFHLIETTYEANLEMKQEIEFLIDVEESLRLVQDKWDFRELCKYESVYISTHHRFYPYGDYLKLFKPTHSIQSAIDSITSTFGDETIGVHIRRTDHVLAIKHSDTAAYIKAMKKLQSEPPQLKFYLATDCQKTKKDLIKEFKSSIIFHEQETDRDSAGGMKNAVLDLFALARCSKILGSSYSSYSMTAAQLGNIEFIPIRS
jgi:hypothetical protein